MSDYLKIKDKVFISWSDDSDQFSEELDKLISNIKLCNTYYSKNKKYAGGKWFDSIMNELESCTSGILCITKSNRNNNWLYIEGGAISYKNYIENKIKSNADQNKDNEKIPLIPVFINFDTDGWRNENPKDFPFGSFEIISFFRKSESEIKKELFRLITTINNSQERPLLAGELKERFDKNIHGSAKIIEIIINLNQPNKNDQDKNPTYHSEAKIYKNQSFNQNSIEQINTLRAIHAKLNDSSIEYSRITYELSEICNIDLKINKLWKEGYINILLCPTIKGPVKYINMTDSGVDFLTENLELLENC